MAYGNRRAITYAEFLERVMPKAQFEPMESGEWFASIPGFVGLWATGTTEEEARKELIDTMLGWLQVKYQGAEPPLIVPVIDGFILSELPKRTE
jgi:predicted RNase H-like HicB family nuclease/predicted RNA binding protein YcfA (HicA-like mRNA interferase family)